LVDRAVCLDAQAVLVDLLPADEARRAAVARLRVDLAQRDHGASSLSLSACRAADAARSDPPGDPPRGGRAPTARGGDPPPFALRTLASVRYALPAPTEAVNDASHDPDPRPRARRRHRRLRRRRHL